MGNYTAPGSGARSLDFSEIKSQAHGRWGMIFEDLIPELSAAMGARGNHVPCPVHGGRDGFRLFKDYTQTGGGVCNSCGAKAGGLAMMAWVRGVTYAEAAREVTQWLRRESFLPEASRRPPPPPPPPKHDPQKAQKALDEIASGLQEIIGTPGERYLAARGIWKHNIPPTLRFHPGLRYYNVKEKKFYGYFPAIVAPIRDANDEIIAAHRIYLTEDGEKAPVPEVKKMTLCRKEPNGAAIKLFRSGEILGVGEGIETMLAVHAITRMPVWSAVSAVMLEKLIVPEHVRVVTIWGDLDVSQRGAEAAEKLRARLVSEGKQVEVFLPEGPIPEGSKGIDWLDVLRERSTAGFPAQYRRYRRAA